MIYLDIIHSCAALPIQECFTVFKGMLPFAKEWLQNIISYVDRGVIRKYMGS